MDSSPKDFIIENVGLNYTLNYSTYAVLAFLVYDTGTPLYVLNLSIFRLYSLQLSFLTVK